jgi:hypothetical protein
LLPPPRLAVVHYNISKRLWFLWRKCTGIEPAQELFTPTLVLKTRRPTRRLGTSHVNILSHDRISFATSTGVDHFCRWNIRDRGAQAPASDHATARSTGTGGPVFVKSGIPFHSRNIVSGRVSPVGTGKEKNPLVRPRHEFLCNGALAWL